MTDQAAFLLVRYDEEETAAARCPSDVMPLVAPMLRLLTDGQRIINHIAYHAPVRVLADIDAKRRIVAEMTGRYLESWTAAQTVLNALCLPFADHPDYDPAWAL